MSTGGLDKRDVSPCIVDYMWKPYKAGESVGGQPVGEVVAHPVDLGEMNPVAAAPAFGCEGDHKS